MSQATKVRLSGEHFQKILRHAEAGYPNEACGLLAGVEQDGVRDIREGRYEWEILELYD